MVKNKKITALVAGALAAILLLGTSFALFTARNSVQSNATTASLNIEIIETETPEGNMLPGDMRTFKYKVQSRGNVDTDIRETIVINAPSGREAFEADTITGQSQFDLYLASDVEQDATGAYLPKEGATPIAVKTIVDGKTIKYQPEIYTLSANEIQEHDYVVVFKKDASNMWKQQEIKFSVVVEAKQNANTAADWSEVETVQYTMGSGLVIDVVVDEDDEFIRVMVDGSLAAQNFEEAFFASTMMQPGMRNTYVATQFGQEVPVELSVSGEGAQYLTIEDNAVFITNDSFASGNSPEYFDAELSITINGTVKTRAMTVVLYPNN